MGPNGYYLQDPPLPCPLSKHGLPSNVMALITSGLWVNYRYYLGIKIFRFTIKCTVLLLP